MRRVLGWVHDGAILMGLALMLVLFIALPLGFAVYIWVMLWLP